MNWARRRAACVFWAAMLAAPARAATTRDSVQRTYWDEMMELQAARTLAFGSVLLEQRRYAEAAKEFARAVVSAPNDPTAHRALGIAYYWSGEVDRAQGEFEESLRLDSSNAQTLLLIGIAHAFKGDGPKALEAFQNAARLDGARADIQMNLGSIEESLGMIAQALVHFRRAVDLDGRQPLYRFQLGTLYGKLGRYEEAAAELQAAIRRYPDYQEAMLELGSLYDRMKRLKDAADMFKRAVRVKPKDSVARYLLARAQLLLGKEGAARDALREVFHLTPADLGEGLALSVSYGGAVATPSQARSGNTLGTAGGGAPAKGSSKGREPEPPAASPSGPLEVLAKNLERIPLDQDAVLKIDMAFLPRPKIVKAKTGEAPSSLKRALERVGKPPAASVVVARREYQLASGSEAQREAAIQKIVEDARQTMAGAPPDSETRFGMNLAFTGKARSGGGRPSGEKRSSVSYNPHDVGNDLGLWVMGTGWMAMIEQTLTTSGERIEHPDDAAWWVLEGIGFSILGNGAEAADAFAHALERNVNDELAHLGRGVARVIVGDEKGAIESYRRVLEINPKNRAASDGLRWLLRGPAGKGGSHGA